MSESTCKVCNGTGVYEVPYRECIHDPHFDGYNYEFEILTIKVRCKCDQRHRLYGRRVRWHHHSQYPHDMIGVVGDFAERGLRTRVMVKFDDREINCHEDDLEIIQ